ncbi:MAG: mechanosensitive ion channel domain-containing protein, partial [Byssovorax sp.]
MSSHDSFSLGVRTRLDLPDAVMRLRGSNVNCSWKQATSSRDQHAWVIQSSSVEARLPARGEVVLNASGGESAQAAGRAYFARYPVARGPARDLLRVSIGDQIVFKEYEGTVEGIQTRATFLETYDGRRVVIPNAELFTQAVLVNTAFEIRRLEYDVGIGFGDDIVGAKALMLDAISEVEGVLKDP